MKEGNKEYTNGEVTIVWKPSLCMHSSICWKGESGLRSVFDPASKPWIKPDGADTERIIDQVSKCPSGALSFYLNKDGKPREDVSSECIVEVAPNGPLLVYGNLTIRDKDGKETQKSNVTAFCRCGNSSNKPFCDGMHRKVGFEG